MFGEQAQLLIKRLLTCFSVNGIFYDIVIYGRFYMGGKTFSVFISYYEESFDYVAYTKLRE